MHRENPAFDLAERAIRRRQYEVARTATIRAQPQAPQSCDVQSAMVPLSPTLVGMLAGFLGALASLGLNVLGAWMLGIEKLKLLRIYATMLDGRTALDPSRTDFFAAALTMHLLAGLFFGAIFAVLTKKFCCSGFAKYLAAGTAFGIGLWVFNFYAILLWLQPLLYGEAFIVAQIPMWVAALTHASYGAALALIAFPFQKDF